MAHKQAAHLFMTIEAHTITWHRYTKVGLGLVYFIDV